MNMNRLNRCKFFTNPGAGSATLAVKPLSLIASEVETAQEKPSANISDAGKIPGNPLSMPGRFPGKLLTTSHAVVQSVIKQLTESGTDWRNIIVWDRIGHDIIAEKFRVRYLIFNEKVLNCDIVPGIRASWIPSSYDL
jgi:hypothetical protein